MYALQTGVRQSGKRMRNLSLSSAGCQAARYQHDAFRNEIQARARRVHESLNSFFQCESRLPLDERAARWLAEIIKKYFDRQWQLADAPPRHLNESQWNAAPPLSEGKAYAADVATHQLPQHFAREMTPGRDEIDVLRFSREKPPAVYPVAANPAFELKAN
jgi:hypothetical protein